jgi:hypothetical protein
MNPMKWLFTLLGRMRRVVGGLVAALLLMPVPALAITYLGSWSAMTTVSGGPKPPTPAIISDAITNGGQNDQLLVNVGQYQGSTATASSQIVLTRQIQITSNSQGIEFDHTYDALFSYGGYTTRVEVDNSKGQAVITPINVSPSNSSAAFKELQDNLNVKQSLAKGTYTLKITIINTTNNKVGGWKFNPGHKSFHEFDFQGQ